MAGNLLQRLVPPAQGQQALHGGGVEAEPQHLGRAAAHNATGRHVARQHRTGGDGGPGSVIVNHGKPIRTHGLGEVGGAVHDEFDARGCHSKLADAQLVAGELEQVAPWRRQLSTVSKSSQYV